MNYHRANLPEDPNAKAGAVMCRRRNPRSRCVTRIAARSDTMAGRRARRCRISGSISCEYLNITIKRRWLILSIVGAALVLAVLQHPDGDAALHIDSSAADRPASGEDRRRRQYHALRGTR